MKKRLFAAFITILVSAILLVGCTFYGNDRSGTQLMEVETGEGQIAFRLANERLVYDTSTKSLRLEEAEWDYGPQAVLHGDTFPRGVLQAEEGYEALKEQALAFAVNAEDPLVHALAWDKDGTVYGFCNVYKSATGYLSGGGQIDTRHIVRAVLFTYDKETQVLTIKEELKKCVVVAYDGENAIYFRDREYFSKRESGTPVKICNDEAFDTGMTSYGYARFYFGGGYCVLFFNYDKGNPKKQYHLYVLATMQGEKLAELKIINPYDL